MKLHEYQSKLILSQYGISSPYGKVVTNPADARIVAQDIAAPVILKAQTFASSRSLAGGFLRADTPDDAFTAAEQLLDSKVNGYAVHKVLVEEYVESLSEVFVAITTDRTVGKPVMVASSQSGLEIHNVISHSADEAFYEIVEPLIGLRDYQIRRLAGNLYVEPAQWSQFEKFVSGLYRCYVATDATLVEINPLATVFRANKNQLLALDAKLYIDGNALFRQPALLAMRDFEGEREDVVYLHDSGMIYHRFDGQIGCMVNGAGLAMAIMDLIYEKGNKNCVPANFLDIGGSAELQSIYDGLKTIISNPNVKVVLVNIFGGVIRCDDVAKGIIRFLQEHPPDLPFVIRLQGTNAEIAHELLAQSGLSGIVHAFSLTDAVQKAIKLICS